MRILLIHQAFVSPQEAGGTRHFEMASRLVRQGYDFSIVASNISYFNGKRQNSKEWISREEIEDVEVLRAYTLPTVHRSFTWRVLSFLSFMVTSVWAGLRAGKVSLVVGTSPPIFQAFSAWIVSVLRWCPFLLEVRDLWPEFAVDMGVLKNPVLIWLSRALENFLYARASHILVNSPAYRDYLIEKGVPSEKISFIANGVDPANFSNSSGEAIRTKYALADKFVAVYAGAMGIANDIETILEAAQILKDDAQIHFLLVGDGKERPQLEERLRLSGIQNVTFTGAVPKQEMASVLAAADVCLATLRDIPMFRTTYPNKVFDYMASSRPIILAIDGVIREVVEAAEAGIFVKPGQPKELASAIETLAKDRLKAKSMGELGRTYVIRHFNRNHQAVELQQLVSQLTDRAA